MVPASIEPLDSVGNACVLFRDKEEKPLLAENKTIPKKVRNNVLISLHARGRISKKIVDNARFLDNFLKEKLSKEKQNSSSYETLFDYPNVKLKIEKSRITLGECVPLTPQVHNPSGLDRYYYWQLSGGGVERDSHGNFCYYASETGQHTITLIVTNSIGFLAVSPETTITVAGCIQ